MVLSLQLIVFFIAIQFELLLSFFLRNNRVPNYTDNLLVFQQSFFRIKVRNLTVFPKEPLPQSALQTQNQQPDTSPRLQREGVNGSEFKTPGNFTYFA